MRDFIKKYKKNFFIVFLIGFGIYFYILSKHNAKEIFIKIKNIHINYIIIVFILLLAYVALESLVIFLFAKKKVKGIGFFTAFRLNLSTQFFNSITPFAAGGQPFQVFYLNARGIKTKDSTSIILMNFITYNIAFVIVGFTCLLYRFNYFNNLLKGEGYKYILLIGFGVNLSVTLLTFVLAFSKKIYHILIEVIWLKIIHWPILRKFKLETKTEKIEKTIDDFNREIKELNHHKLLWVQAVFYHILRIVLFYAIPLFIFMALGESVHGNEANLVVGAIFVAMVMSYIPSPGASGGAEGLFYVIFSFFFQKGALAPALLLWRFITYYFYLLLGFIALLTLNYTKNLREINYPEETLATKESI
ncbi:flippase-like domain-containing protein [Mycoplasmatota bacterium]|nr:flippase-like domain-containing protein [Mycoplasmatota bacterium]